MPGCNREADEYQRTNEATRTFPPNEKSSTPRLVGNSENLDEFFKRRDPEFDGWTTEVVNEQAGVQLNQLGDWLSDPVSISLESAEGLLSNTIRFSSLRPELTEIFRDSRFQIQRSSVGEPPLNGEFEGVKTFVNAYRSFANVFGGNDHVHYKFKIIRVSELGDRIETEAYFQADASTEQESIQVNATWHCAWQREGRGLILNALVVRDYEEVKGSFPGGHLFADCTEAVLNRNDSFADQILKSTNHWRAELQGSLGVDLLGHQGLAIGDANGDGLDDLYVCQPGGVINRLYIQQPDGTALDQTEAAGLDFLDRTRAALFVDLDNDLDQDLVLMVDTQVLFLRNDGLGNFEIAANQFVGTSVTLTAADYDLDGDLDLYVCGYSAPRGGEGAPTPYHDANNGFQNRLLENEISDSQWVFTDVTEQVGLDQNNRRFTLSAAWEDFDNDGDQDLYVANDFGRNNLFRNDNGHFTDIAAAAGVEDISAGMGVAWGDFNRDGLFDIYVSNMFSSAGNRVAFQRKFRPDDDADARTEFQRHARGNSLFENVGDGTFRDISVEAHVTMGRWAWASLFCDVNNDSTLDILVTNGLATNEDTKDL